MKKLLFFFALVATLQLQAQNKSLGVGTTTPNTNAALDVVSPTNNQGLLVPRLTSAQRISMSLGAADVGLIVYDLNLNSIHTWNGSTWEDAGVAEKLAIPYKDSVVTSTGGKPLIHIKHNAPNIASILYLEQIDTTNIVNPFVIQQNGKGAAMNVVQNNKTGTGGIFQTNNALNNGFSMRATTFGTGSAGRFQVNNATSGGTAVWATTNSNLGGVLSPVAVYGESTGTGSSGGAFRNQNAANPLSALYSETFGTGSAGIFNINNASNNSSVVSASTNGLGAAVFGVNSGPGDSFSPAGHFIVNNATNNHAAIQGNNDGNGAAGQFLIGRAANSAAAVNANTIGTGLAGNFVINNASNSNAGLSASTNGTGAAIEGKQTGTGYGVYATSKNTDAIYAEKKAADGTGSAGNFQNFEPTNAASTLFAMTNSPSPAIGAINSAGGNAIAMFQGGFQLAAVSAITAPTTLTAKAGLYEISAGPADAAVNLPSTGSVGEICWVSNTSGVNIKVNGSLDVATGTVKQFIRLTGGWKRID